MFTAQTHTQTHTRNIQPDFKSGPTSGLRLTSGPTKNISFKFHILVCSIMFLLKLDYFEYMFFDLLIFKFLMRIKK